MGWGQHPDTLSMSEADSEAMKVSIDTSSLAYMKEYRRVYEQQNQRDQNTSGLNSYIASLDEEIKWIESGGTMASLNAKRRSDFANRNLKKSGSTDR